jgi:hypothetical protein
MWSIQSGLGHSGWESRAYFNDPPGAGHAVAADRATSRAGQSAAARLCAARQIRDKQQLDLRIIDRVAMRVCQRRALQPGIQAALRNNPSGSASDRLMMP